ncbi:MAG TPA: CHAD domain-containing protein [Burkholderiales bacterium]|nr:CHAD domain-containing protein [Burkholderiales bacterium]
MLPVRALKRVRDPSNRRDAIAGPLKWQAVLLGKADSASVVFSKTGCALLAQLRANEAGALADQDPEYLHQIRVTVRRLRAILSLYSEPLGRRARKSVDRELKWLAHALGPARDSHVFMHDIWPPLRDVLDHGQWVETLNAEWLVQRRRNARVAHRALSSQRYRRMMHELEQWFSAQRWLELATAGERMAWTRRARAFARRELEYRAEHVRGYGRSLGDLDPEALHRLRIEIKKLRYMMDALSSLFKRARVKKMLDALSNLQEILGELNDVAVAVQKIGETLPKKKSADLTQLRRQIADWQVLRTKDLKRKLAAAWRAYRHVEPFW